MFLSLLQIRLKAVAAVTSSAIISMASGVFQPTWEPWSSACSLTRRTTVFTVLFTKQRYNAISVALSYKHRLIVASSPSSGQQKHCNSFMATQNVSLPAAVFSLTCSSHALNRLSLQDKIILGQEEMLGNVVVAVKSWYCPRTQALYCVSYRHLMLIM